MNLTEIRRQFPALERVHQGHQVAYFDGPGGTQAPRAVGEAMLDYLYHHNANTHWAYPTSQETDAILANSRQALADFLNARPDEVVFGPNMTTLTFHVSRALGQQWSPGDEIVVTELDHHANVDPWKRVARERGLVIRTVPMNPETGQLVGNGVEAAITSKTKLVAIGAASNALGTINNVSKVADLAHSVGALCFVDAVHYAPHELVDVQAMGCDFLACSAYKFYGPHLGVLYGRHQLLEALDTPKLEPASNHAPDRIETGTQNHEGIAGAAAAVDFLASLDLDSTKTRRARLQTAFQSLHDHGQKLVGQLWSQLQNLPNVRLFGSPPHSGLPRTPTISLIIEDQPSELVARRLAKHGLFVSNGNFYALTVARKLGQNELGLVRIGCACYSTQDEVDRLIYAISAND